ncbi:monovalent cation/H(+) antiporter subunit G [Bacillaceae bacterium S4-13-58]
MIEIIISFFILVGTIVTVSASIGILRFPDIYTRMHAATKSATLGVSSIMIASFLYLFDLHGVSSGKLILAIIFVLLTAPVSGHMISRAAYRSGVKLWDKSVRDDYAKTLPTYQKER